MSISVRLAEAGDIDAIAAIEAECFSEPWSAQAFADVLYREDVILLVADIGGEDKIVGYVCMYMAADEGEITNVAVKSDCRGRGIAGGLMDDLISRAKDHAIEMIFLEVRESNAPAIALYKKNGFEQNGLRKNFYRNPTENAILMAKDLREQKV